METKRSKQRCTKSSSAVFVVVRFYPFVVLSLCIDPCAWSWVTVSCTASIFSELVCLVTFSQPMLFPWLTVNRVRVACSCPICFVTLIVVGSPKPDIMRWWEGYFVTPTQSLTPPNGCSMYNREPNPAPSLQ